MPISLVNTNGTGGIALNNTNNSGRISSAIVTVTDQIRAQLTTSLSAYNIATVGNWVKVTAAEYNNIVANIPGATKKGNSDVQISTRDVLTSFSGQWISFGSAAGPSFQIDTGEYVIAMITEAWNQSGGSCALGYTTSFTGSSIISITGSSGASTAGPTTGGGRDYFIRKAPIDVATETRYPTLIMTVSPNAVNNWPGYRSITGNPTSWVSLPTNQVSKIQIVTTSTKSW